MKRGRQLLVTSFDPGALDIIRELAPGVDNVGEVFSTLTAGVGTAE